jgi:hypothetical protein
MNIEIPSKRFFIIMVVIFGVLLISGAFAVYDPTKGSHDTLWTDRIESKTGSKVIVAGDLEVTGKLTGSQAAGGSSLSGTMCGYYAGNCGGAYWACQGHNPFVDCPDGYSRQSITYCGTSNTQTAWMCVKD